MHLDSYLVYAIDFNGEIDRYELSSTEAFETIDELINQLKGSYEPDFNLTAFDEYNEKNSNNIMFNAGIKEKLRTGYQKEALKAELIKEVQ